MILQRLPRFLAEINAKLLIKYDGERRTKKYTILFLLKDIKLNSIGGDTDLPVSLLSDIFNKENAFFEMEEIVSLYDTINRGIEKIKTKFGNDCVISVLIEEKEGNSLYTIFIQTEKEIEPLSGPNYMELYNALL